MPPLEPHKPSTEIIRETWMKDLSDSLKLSQITIPGTHNSHAVYGTFYRVLPFLPVPIMESWVSCQSAEHAIEWQLKAGVRFLDLRCRWDADSKVLRMCHSDYDIYGNDRALGQVITRIRQFLQQYPSEAVIVSIKAEAGPGPQFAQAVYDVIAANWSDWYLAHEVPSLQECRGKLVLFRRYSEEDAPYLATNGSVGLPSGGVLQETPNMKFQDNYNPYREGFTLPQCYDCKWTNIESLFTESTAAVYPHALYVNFISGYVNLPWSWVQSRPYTFAVEMNKRVHEYLDRHNNRPKTVNLGITILDFPEVGRNQAKSQPDLIDRLLRMNFTNC